ncbi:MAG: glycosyltransferase, exosortase A system-associated [Gammaproteobacteria bacterium]|jgi:PEP-CTERM/exosortase A-associated glycosyltransferase
MKILHVFDHSIPLHSGYTFRSRAILREQRKLGWETAHVTSPKHAAQLAVQRKETPLEEDVEGLHFYRAPLPRGILARLPAFDQLAVVNSLTGRLSQVVLDVQPDIVHAHSPALNGVAALRVARKFKLPLVYEVRAFWEDAAVDHGTCREGDARYRATRALETYVLRRADAVTCICEGLRGDIMARGIPVEKVTVIPNAVDIEHFHCGGVPDPDLQQHLGLTGRLVLGFIGSFYAYEGLGLLLDALPKLLAEREDIRLLLVGGGYEEQRLKQQAQDLGLDDKIIFTGRVPHAEVQRYYDLVDVLVYPRLSMRITDLVTPLKPLEAMAQGRLVVASDVGGHRELIRDGETGCLFRAGDAVHLADTVLQLLESHQLWPALRSAARHFVEQERNWPVSIVRYQQVYLPLIER